MGAELLSLFYLVQPFAVVVALALTVVAFGGAVISRPVVPLVLYLAIFFVFAQSNFGSLDVYLANPIYARGSGWLYYPALCWVLLVLLFWAWLGRRFAALPLPTRTPVQTWLWVWLALLALHLTAGLLLDVPGRETLDNHGFAQLVWMLPLVLLMQWSGRDGQTLDALARLLVLAGLLKATYGLLRWGLFGGDPANVYQNFGQIDVRLTYFDIADNLVCLLGAAAAAAMLLVTPSPRHGKAWRVLCVLTLVLTLGCIVLSYRRAAWGGLVLAALWLVLQADRRARWPLLLVALPLGVVAVAWVAAQRLAVQAGGLSATAYFFDLMGNRFGPESTRSLELRLAWQAFTDSPLVGIGAWGHYPNSHLIPWQLRSGGSFVHSGVLHVLMKAGLLGLGLLIGLVWAFTRELRQGLTAVDPAARVLLLVAACGLLFMLPDFLFGTPLPQLRSMQLIGFCLGLPGLVAAALSMPASTQHNPLRR